MAGGKGIRAGGLYVEMWAELARLQSDMDKAKRMVGSASKDISSSAGYANDNLSKWGNTLGKVGTQSRAMGAHSINLARNLSDVGQGFALGQKPMTIFLQQGFQIAEVLSLMKMEASASGRTLTGTLLSGLGRVAPALLRASGIASVFAIGIGMLSSEINKNAKVQVTWGDTILGTFDAIKAGISNSVVSAFDAMGIDIGDVWDSVVGFTKDAINTIIAYAVVVPRMIVATYDKIPEAIGDAFYSGANLAIESLNWLLSKAAAGVNLLVETFNAVFGTQIGKVAFEGFDTLNNRFAGGMRALGASGAEAFTASFSQDYLGDAAAAISPFAQDRAVERLAKDAKKAGKKAGREAGKEAAKNFGLTFAEAFSDLQQMIDARKSADAQKLSNKDELARLQKELELIGATNREREVQLALLQAAQFIRDNDTAPEDQAALVKTYVDLANATVTLQESQDNYNDSLNATLNLLQLIEDNASILGGILQSAFGEFGSGVGGIVQSLATWQAKQEEIARDAAEAKKRAGTDTIALARIETEAAKRSGNAQMEAVGGVLASAKSLFKEHSAGYKAMEAAERAYALVQLVNTAKSVAAGAAKMFEMLGPFGFAAVAAMLGVMASLGFSGGGGSRRSVPTAEEVQAQQGAGTVLGDATAKSESIANSLEIMAKNSTKGLDHSGSMVRSLRNIETGIGALASAIARSLSLEGGSFDTSGLGLGSTTKGLFDMTGGFMGIGGIAGMVLNKLPVVGDILGAIGKVIFSVKKTVTLLDQGIEVNAASVQQILDQGLQGLTYQTIQIQKKKKLFGISIGGSTKTETTTGELDSEIERQMSLIIGDLYDTVVEAARIIGLDVADVLKTFEVEIGKISFKDLKGDEIQSALEAVFSKIGDQMAGFAVDGLEEFQQAGEGLYETLLRLAKNYLTIDAALASIGKTFGAVGASSIAAREALINLMGGLDEFVSKVNYYYENFLTDAERLSFLQGQIDTAFAQLGLPEPTTIQQFKDLVSGLDLTTEAGQATFAALMDIAPAFYEVANAAQEAAAAAQAQKEAAAEAARAEKQRAIDAAKSTLKQAYDREAQALEQRISNENALADSLRSLSAELMGGVAAADNYQTLLGNLNRIGASARNSPEAAAQLAGAINDFLPAAKAQSATQLDYQRQVMMAARLANNAADAAEDRAAEAQRRLTEITDKVGKLVDISEDGFMSVEEAIRELVRLQGGGTGTGGTTTTRPTLPSWWTGGSRFGSIRDGRGSILDRLFGDGDPTRYITDPGRTPANSNDTTELTAAVNRMGERLDRIDANTAQTAVGTNGMNRRLADLEVDGALAITNITEAA